eukprot:332235_1
MTTLNNFFEVTGIPCILSKNDNIWLLKQATGNPTQITANSIQQWTEFIQSQPHWLVNKWYTLMSKFDSDYKALKHILNSKSNSNHFINMDNELNRRMLKFVEMIQTYDMGKHATNGDDSNEDINSNNYISKTNVYITGLPTQWSEHEMTQFLTHFGTITSCLSCKDRFNGHSVNFENEKAAQNCIHDLNGKRFQGSILSVKYAKKSRFDQRYQIPNKSNTNNCNSQTNVYFNGVPGNWNQNDIKFHFGKFGCTTSIKLFTDRFGGGYGFINFRYPEAAQDCIREMKRKILGHGLRPLTINYANDRYSPSISKSNRNTRSRSRSRSRTRSRSPKHNRNKYDRCRSNESTDIDYKHKKRKVLSKRNVNKKNVNENGNVCVIER